MCSKRLEGLTLAPSPRIPQENKIHIIVWGFFPTLEFPINSNRPRILVPLLLQNQFKNSLSMKKNILIKYSAHSLTKSSLKLKF